MTMIVSNQHAFFIPSRLQKSEDLDLVLRSPHS